MAMGERTPLALLDAAASGRMAVGEALTNMAAADVRSLGDIKLSANWMAAAGHGHEDAALYATVRAVGEQLCPALGIAIPVGKDSMSMKTRWTGADSRPHEVVAPVSLIVSAFAPVDDVRHTLTPQLLPFAAPSALFLLHLAPGDARIGGSALAQVYGRLSENTPPDVDDPALLRRFFGAVRAAARAGHAVAYHDRSDGGLLVTLLEMAMAGRQSVDVDMAAVLALAPAGTPPLQALFAEELGAVVQVPADHMAAFVALMEAHGVREGVALARVGTAMVPAVAGHAELHVPPLLPHVSVAELTRVWATTSYKMAAMRDDPDCAAEEFAGVADPADPGLTAHLTFPFPRTPPGPTPAPRPRVAILREQGVNGHLEMAMAFVRAGFDACDVHMTDILSGHVTLASFVGLAAVGGFSYGDVLGAGEGWAKSILFHPGARAAFAAFFARPDTFAVGMCNGCQMLSALKELIPGTALWPRFVRNRSEQYEARLVQVQVPANTTSAVVGPMAGSLLPVAVAHGEGRAVFADAPDQEAAAAALAAAGQVALRYVDATGQPARQYPRNPNGSAGAIAGVCSADGRVTIVMPHPERVARWAVNSFVPPQVRAAVRAAGGDVTAGDTDAILPDHLDEGPWMEVFHSARRWVRT
jgi:phosphoribosylformylglycinamidine synthase